MAPPGRLAIDNYLVTPTLAGGGTALVDARSTTTTTKGDRSFFTVLKTDAFVTVSPRARFVVGEGTPKQPGTKTIESYLRALRQPRCVREAQVTACEGIPRAVEAFMRDFGPPGFRQADHLIATPKQWTDHLARLAHAMQGTLHVAALHARVRSEIGRALEGEIAMLKGRLEHKLPRTPSELWQMKMGGHLTPPEAWSMARLVELAHNWMMATPGGKPDGALKGAVDTLTTLLKRAVVRGVD